MGRAPCCEKTGLKKGPWTAEEDQKLLAYIQKHGYGSWRTLPKNAGLQRCGKSCRLRWTNYLRPDIKRGRFSFEEEETIVQLHSILGNKWSAIAARLPGRTDNEIKNYWNTHIRKKLLRMGIDPVTHHPRLDLLLNLNPTLYCSSQIPDLNLLGFQNPNLMNPQLLRSLACFLNSPPDSGNVLLHQSHLINNNNNNYVDQSLPELIQPSSNFASNLSQTDCQLMQQNNVGSLLENLSDGSELLPTLSELGFVDEPYYGGNGSGLAGVDPSSSPEALNIPNFGCQSSLMSTPSSNSTYNVNSCSELDERESYYCSNSSMLKFEKPDIWDASYLM